MNKYVSFLSVFLCSNLIAGSANAEGSKSFDITLVNKTASDITLHRSSWSLGQYVAGDYTIPVHFTGTFNVSVPGERKGAMAFTYVTDNTACKYEAGYELVRVRGWLHPTYEVMPWSKAGSVGSFGAICKSSIVENASADGYTLQLVIE